MAVISKAIRITGGNTGSAADFRAATAAIAAHKLEPVVAQTFAVADINWLATRCCAATVSASSRSDSTGKERDLTRLLGKHALITGGTSGIGLETARQFIAEGATVAVTGLSEARLAAAKRELGDDVLTIRSEAGDAAAQEALATELKMVWPKLDVLFANAGDVTHRPLADADIRSGRGSRVTRTVHAALEVYGRHSVHHRRARPDEAPFSRGCVRSQAIDLSSFMTRIRSRDFARVRRRSRDGMAYRMVSSCE